MAFLFRLLPPRPTFPDDMNPAEAEVMERHSGYWMDLMTRAVAVAYGPVLDPKGTWGLGLVAIDDEAAAREVAEHDPAVESGVFSFEMLPIDLVKPG
jgi:uncharacterized protein